MGCEVLRPYGEMPKASDCDEQYTWSERCENVLPAPKSTHATSTAHTLFQDARGRQRLRLHRLLYRTNAGRSHGARAVDIRQAPGSWWRRACAREMCGNGVRCVAHLVVARGYAVAGLVTIETGRGVLTLQVTRSSPQKSMVRVDMGEPLLRAVDIPVATDAAQDAELIAAPCPALGPKKDWWEAVGLDPRMTCVSMGNPHVIFFCRETAGVPLEIIGPHLESHPLFPKRVNVHFVEVLSLDRVKMRTWERGSGITQACGTGASAVCVAGVLCGLTKKAISAEVPGGLLHLEWADSGTVFMTGPAEEVFTGSWLRD